MKRFILAFVAAFIFIFFWGWLYNGVLLKDVFAEAQSLFRPREEMMSLFRWIVIGQAGLALAFVMIYASGFAGGGIAAGVRLGSVGGGPVHADVFPAARPVVGRHHRPRRRRLGRPAAVNHRRLRLCARDTQS